MADTRNHATRRKQENIQAIRDRLSQYGHHDQAIVLLEKLQDETIPLDQAEVNRMKIALDGHIKMMNHYMPKVTEISSPETPEIKITYNKPKKPDGA